MILSYRLLKETNDFEYSPEELSERLTSIGIEVESIERYFPNFKNIYTGKILLIEKVPRTNLLKVIVDTGKEKQQIITAATNIKNGDIVPVALPQSILSDGSLIRSKDFNGIESNGMLCSAQELGLENECLSAEEKEGIFIFPEDTPSGIPVENLIPIEDVILELSLLPDRADAFSVIGIARWVEVFKSQDRQLKADFSKLIPSVDLKTYGETQTGLEILNSNLCPFYSGREILHVNVKHSSLTIRQKLYMLRIKPINNIVDITNYITKFYGQPLHAFDLDKLDSKIIVRLAKHGERIRTLDNIERELDESILVIADKQKPVAIAGIMGGEETSVKEETTNVFLESAYFSPSSIARSARMLGMTTDASSLFEKGVDYSFTPKASFIASSLIAGESDGIPMKEKSLSYIVERNPVKVRFSKINSLLGEEIDREEVRKYFDFEGLESRKSADTLEIISPSFRQDINIEEDLIEEVVRMKGYNEFKEKLLEGELRRAKRTDYENFTWLLKQKLVSMGLVEVQTATLISQKDLDSCYLTRERPIKLLNPLTEDMNILRSSLFPTMLGVFQRNLNAGRENVALFEIGKVFEENNNEFSEHEEIGIILSGEKFDKNGFKRSLHYDFYYLKGLLEELLHTLKIRNTFERGEVPYLHPYQTSFVVSVDERIGFMGKIKGEIHKDAYFAMISVPSLYRKANLTYHFEEFSIYPPVKRDIAIIIDEKVDEGNVRNTIISLDIKELKNIKLFDIYKGPPLPEGKKNLAYSLEFSSLQRTLRREEIEEYISLISDTIEKKLGGTLRTK